MKILKAAIVVLLALSLSVWSASQGVLPVGETVQDLAIGVVGTVGLALATVFRVLLAALVPLFVMLRVLVVPLALGGIAYLAVRAFRRA